MSVPPPRLGQENPPPTASPTAAATGAPRALFACDPAVEARLLDDDVVRIFLRHMRKPTPTTSPTAPAPARDAPITDEEVRALLQRHITLPDEPPPNLLEGLPQERLWILADIAKVGGGLARQRATAELREAMHDLGSWEGVNDLVLAQLVRLLEEASHSGEMSVLFKTLHLAAQRALRQSGRGEPGDP